MNMITDFEKVKRVFESCENYSQFNIAKNMLVIFFEKYNEEFDSLSKQKTMSQIQQIMDDCVARLQH